MVTDSCGWSHFSQEKVLSMPAKRTDTEFGGRAGRTAPMEFVPTPDLSAEDRARLSRAIEPTDGSTTEEQVRAAEEKRSQRADKVGR